MEEKGEETAEEVLYEIRNHGNMTFTSDSFKQEVASGSREGWMSYLSFQGAKQLKERWNQYTRPKSFSKITCLMVSPSGEYVVIAVGNRITILQKDDDYKHPIGVFTSTDMLSVFTSGAWLEPQGILGVISDMSTLILLKSSGEEIARRTRGQLKLSAPIIDLILLNSLDSEESFRHIFCLFTENGLLYHVDTSQGPNACIYPVPILPNHITDKNNLPKKVSCLDFHTDLSFGVLVDSPINSGFCSVYLFRLTGNLEIKIMFCLPQFDGVFSTPKGYRHPHSTAKVSISPHAKHLAIIDLTGAISIFNMDTEKNSLSHVSLVLENDESLVGNSDISWWTDNILVVAKRDGAISMHNIVNGRKVMDHDLKSIIVAIERNKFCQEHIFVLESNLSDDNMSLNENLFDIGKNQWKLLSLVGKSVSEMYSFLICNQQYQSALDFSNRHKLDKNEVFKAQWLDSNQGIQEINNILPKITDKMFVLSECLDKVGPTEDIVRSLLSYGLRITEDYQFADVSNDGEIWDILAVRLQLLQYRDKLETFVGINMGRFSAKEYKKFRAIPLNKTATSLAESGKIGALNLLFKRHPYSLFPQILHILLSIPETVPVQSYSQLLPGRSPPNVVSSREVDWVECENTISYLSNLPSNSDNFLHLKTENILKLSMGLAWPSTTDLTEWYKNRARDIDYLSGQVENCLSLLEFACNNKGIVELQRFLEDALYLNQLIYSIDFEEDFTMSLTAWEQLSDYDKFKIMLKGVQDETVVKRLQDIAVPFMNKRSANESESFIVRWLKESAQENQLEICLAVIENGCSDFTINGLFRDESEIVETALDCINLCTLTDQWNIMASILSILPRKISRDMTGKEVNSKHGTQSLGIPRFSYLRSRANDENVESHDSRDSMENLDSNSFDDKLEKRIKIVEGHVEVGRLLAFYQVPKPVSFFSSSQSDEHIVRQLLRQMLSKFGRSPPARSDNDWANLWHDMQCFQEKAFPFLDSEYMLIEFCRGLLKAGKFSLARNYLKGTSSIPLATEKAESLIIQAAREYFFSASDRSCLEVWKAKECLSLFPNSKTVQAESNIIEALTERLPNLGVTLLPVEYKKKDPMEVINMAITSQPGNYLNVDEIIEIAKLLGIDSPENIATVEETIAREAAVAGDLQLAFDLCLVLSKKGHGRIWDLCAAIARGPHLENMDASSRKQLLSFALCHCDEESIGELLNAWKDVDIHMQCESLIVATRTNPPNYLVQGSSVIPIPIQSVHDIFVLIDGVTSDDSQYDNIKDVLSKVGEELTFDEDGVSWYSLLRENRKVLSFAALELPWLVELSKKEEYGRKESQQYISLQTHALICTFYWLANNGIAPSDDLLASIAKSIMEPPASKDEDTLGCSFLLNLVDAVKGVEIIEAQMKQRKGYQEMFNIMNIGMLYSSLQNLHRECLSPEERRNLLICKFREEHASFSSDKQEQIDEAQSTFWREWKLRLEEQKRLADEARNLEQTIPGVETARFLSGDAEYIKSVIYSFIDSVKAEKKHIFKKAVTLADIYGLNHKEVLLRYFGSVLVSNHWDNDDILKEISEFREDIVKCAKEVIDMISCIVYPEISGYNKHRLSYIYSILSACYLRLKKTDEKSLAAVSHQYQQHKKHKLDSFEFYKVLEQECQRVSLINDLNFKNIAALDDLNFDNFNEEVSANINELTVETLADMTRAVFSMYSNSEATANLMSWQDVYKIYIQSNITYLEKEVESRIESNVSTDDLQEIVGKIEANYEGCKKYIKLLSESDQLDIIRRYFYLCIPPCSSPSSKLFEGHTQNQVLFMVLNFYIKMSDEGLDTSCLAKCLSILKELLSEGKISVECIWNAITNYSKIGLSSGLATDISVFLQAMIFSGCEYNIVSKVYFEAELHTKSLNPDMKINNLLDLYLYLMERSLLALSRGSQDNQNLHYLLSSLRKFDRDQYSDDLNAIRYRVWQKLTAFSDDMELESQLRVHALELMQAITGQNLTNLPDKLISMVQPWEAWEHACSTTSSATANTLIALKSTRLVSAISPEIKITPEDLLTLDSSASCFLRLMEMATSLHHINVLGAVLDEWEVLFHSNKEQVGSLETAVEEPNNWSSDEWDNEGWEDNFPEETSIKNEVKNTEKQYSIRPLHSCWMEVMKKLVAFSKVETVLELLDKSYSRADPQEVLIDEDEAKCLYQLVSPIDCSSAMKIVLLLPYKELQLQCLPEFTSKYDISVEHGYEILIVLLLSGTLKDITTKPNLGKTLSYLCHLVGYLARHAQESFCHDADISDYKKEILFSSVILPCFISQLIEPGQILLAGFIVSQSMHTHSSLSLLDIAEASVRKYLEGKLHACNQKPESDCESCGSLMHSLSHLKNKAKSMFESALSTLG